jgi:signal transduction histidine kinase
VFVPASYPGQGARGSHGLRQRLTTVCVILLVAGVTLDHRPIPRQLDTVVALLGTALAAGLAVRSAPRTRVLYLAAGLFGGAVALSSLPIRRTYPLLGMGHAFYLPALVVFLIAAVLAWPELRDSLTQDREKLRTAAVEASRAHTGRELHDETLQALIHLRRSLERAALSADPETARTALDDGAMLAAEQIGALRDIIADIHPTILTELGLEPALEALVDRTARQNPQISVEFCAAAGGPVVGSAIALTVYRIAQESLTNAVKHSGATKVTVALSWHARGLTVEIKDNGSGIQTPLRLNGGGGLGIPAMRARTELHNGRFAIQSAPGAGTTINAQLPLDS